MCSHPCGTMSSVGLDWIQSFRVPYLWLDSVFKGNKGLQLTEDYQVVQVQGCLLMPSQHNHLYAGHYRASLEIEDHIHCRWWISGPNAFTSRLET